MTSSRLGAAYRRLWWAASASHLAEGLVQTGMPLLAASLTRSPSLVAGVSVATNLPWLLLAMHSGALADRQDRRRLMLGANVLRAAAVTVLALGIAVEASPIVLLYAVAFAIGIGQTLFDTSSQSIVPMLAPSDRLAAANGRIQAAQLSVREFAAPPLAGALVAAGFLAVFTTAAVAYAAGIVLLAGLAGTYRPAQTRRVSVHRAAVDGLTYTWRHPILRPLALLGAATHGLFAAWMAVFVLYAVDPGPMGLSELGYGLLFTASAAGSVTGTLLAERLEPRLGAQRILLLSLAGWTVFLGAPAVTTSGLLVGTAFFIGSTGGVMWGVMSITIKQRITPPELLGRVNAGYRLFAWGALPVGAALGGIAGELLPLSGLFAATAAATALLALPVKLRLGADRLDHDLDATERT